MFVIEYCYPDNHKQYVKWNNGYLRIELENMIEDATLSDNLELMRGIKKLLEVARKGDYKKVSIMEVKEIKYCLDKEVR